MGFVDDESDSEAETLTRYSELDEESELPNGKRSPVLRHSFTRPTSSLNGPRTKSNGDNHFAPMRRTGITESEEIWEELEDDTVGEITPFARRKSSAQSAPSPRAPHQGLATEATPNESTALLGRSGTGRSYRDKAMRRSSHLSESQKRNGRSKSTSSQEAQGGWLRMKRLFSFRDWKDKDTGRGDEDRNENGNGNGACGGD